MLLLRLLLRLLLLLATLFVATVYCLLYVSGYGVLLLVIHIYPRVTCCRLLFALVIPNETEDVPRNAAISPESSSTCDETLRCKKFSTKSRRNCVAIRV